MADSKIFPIMQRHFHFKKDMLEHVEVLGGLDRGCSLTKIIYVDNKDKADLSNPEQKYVQLTVALFPNAQFEEALIWLRNNAAFPEDKSHPFHITGAGGAKFSEQIKSILGRDTLFIDEFMSQSRGAYYLLTNVPLNESTFEEVKSDKEFKMSIPFLDNMKGQFFEAIGDDIMNRDKSSLFPCIFGFMGSGGGFVYIGEDGKFRMVSGLPAAGKTFVGLSRCILGTNDYKKIMEMAERGNRANVDTQVKDIIEEIPNWEMQPEMPIFHLGKLAETKKSITEFNKDDIARSLCSLFGFNAMNAAIHACMSEKAKNVFFGGNLFQGEIIRKEFYQQLHTFDVNYVNFYFVNNGHTGALGAMISQPSDMEKYFQMG